MWRLLSGRIASMIPLLGLIVFLSFLLVRLAPGGPFDRDRAPASPEIERALRARYHLDDPVWRQFLLFAGSALRGDLGPSLKHRNHGVTRLIREGLPVSLTIGALAFLAAVGLGTALGFVGAVWRGHWADWGSSAAMLLAVTLPGFVVGPILITLLAVQREWFPVALWGGPWHWVLPVATLAIFHGGRCARLVREGTIRALNAEFVRAARARGASEMRVLMRHVLPVGILPMVSYAGPMLADLLTGSFIVENLFQLPGIGTLTVSSALNRDYPLIVGLVLLYAVLLIGLNLAVDLVHAWLDPRVRHD